MYDEYDKPLHSPPKWRSMQSEGRSLDEAKVDAAIANLLNEEVPKEESTTVGPRAQFLETEAEVPEGGIATSLRQKLAELCGAA